ncbi:Bcr/CflA family efflux MFS transporter [Glaciihabitans arcticus]|uniref:Bcr/CflA family efflux MFS transporter n=1 Tax=Glaciihabitans arcticus TaxID=2668039 RepID=A0A4Q9GQB9_9MICO|nr:multidrug effflux MFS transporter [Glaciihabitans arcticus]TBN55445.1 Bcr/CflA family efflux MFS transporter [Glaciihabitans arcticus]
MTTVVHPGDSLTPRQKLVYIVVLGALTALGPFTIDLYLPAFPVLEADLGVTSAAIQLTLTATTIGFALGQLFVGPWSDKVGRRVPLIVATSVHIIASFGVALAPDIFWVGVFRVLQGVGAAGGGVVAMAMVRDLFGGLPLVRMLSRLALVSGLAPILAPLIGSQLLRFIDWRGIFWFLTAYGLLVILAAIFFIVETLPAARRGDRGHSTTRERYKALFSDRVFVGVTIIAGMTFSGLFAYLSASPFLFQDFYGLDAQQYGFLFAVNSLGVVAGVQISARLARRIGPQWILLGAVSGMLVSALVIVGVNLAGGGLVGVLIPLWFFILSCGFAFPCQQVLALAGHGGEAATAASLMGAVNFGLAGLISPIVGLLGIHVVAMGGVMAVTSVVSLFSMWILVRPRTVPALAR